MAFKLNKLQSQTNAPCCQRQFEMSDNGNVSTLKYASNPRLSRTKWLQLNMMLGVASWCGQRQLQAIAFQSPSGELLFNLGAN